MITFKDFESNCKRIAKAIMKEARDPMSPAVLVGIVELDISKNLVFDFNLYKAKYLKEINKHLKGCSVTFNSLNKSSVYTYIGFNIEFEGI